MRPSAIRTFMDDLRAGIVTPDDIDEYVNRWHEADTYSSASEMPLHIYLGMTFDEYT